MGIIAAPSPASLGRSCPYLGHPPGEGLGLQPTANWHCWTAPSSSPRGTRREQAVPSLPTPPTRSAPRCRHRQPRQAGVGCGVNPPQDPLLGMPRARSILGDHSPPALPGTRLRGQPGSDPAGGQRLCGQGGGHPLGKRFGGREAPGSSLQGLPTHPQAVSPSRGWDGHRGGDWKARTTPPPPLQAEEHPSSTHLSHGRSKPGRGRAP